MKLDKPVDLRRGQVAVDFRNERATTAGLHVAIGGVLGRVTVHYHSRMAGKIDEAAEPTSRVREGDVTRTITRGEAVLLANCHRSLKKDQSAMNNILMLADRYGLILDRREDGGIGNPILAPSKFETTEEWLEWCQVYQRYVVDLREVLALEQELDLGKPGVCFWM